MILSDCGERAAILEFDGGMSRLDAEAQAFQEISAQRIAADPPGILGELALAERRRAHPDLASALAALGLIGVRAPTWGFGDVVADGETYRPALDTETARSAFVVPAINGGAVTDLMACTIVKPRRMRSRLGIAHTLGADEISRAREIGMPLYVFEDAVQWLYGHTLGVVILDWKRGAGEIEGVEELICGTAMAPRLYEATRRLLPRPTIACPAERMRHAA
jgi:hypothetical protein